MLTPLSFQGVSGNRTRHRLANPAPSVGTTSPALKPDGQIPGFADHVLPCRSIVCGLVFVSSPLFLDHLHTLKVCAARPNVFCLLRSVSVPWMQLQEIKRCCGNDNEHNKKKSDALIHEERR